MEMGNISLKMVYCTKVPYSGANICKSQGEKIYNIFDLMMAIMVETVGNVDISGYLTFPNIHNTHTTLNDRDKSFLNTKLSPINQYSVETQE